MPEAPGFSLTLLHLHKLKQSLCLKVRGMQYRCLGTTGLSVSRIGIGGLPVQKVNQGAVINIVRAAKSNGINFIDTARSYHASEKKLGIALRNVRAGFFIASKAAERTSHGILSSIYRSLKALSVDYIDLYQVHNLATVSVLRDVLSPAGALAGLRQAQEAGLIRHVGVTGHNPAVLLMAINTGEFSTVQAPYNPLEQQFMSVFCRAKELSMGTIAMKPLAGGAFRRVDLALRDSLNQQLIDILIPGVDSVRQVEQNARLTDIDHSITDPEKELLSQEVKELEGNLCRRCGYCMPCPVGIRIPSVLLLDAYLTRYKLMSYAQRRYGSLKSKASQCTACGLCELHCPYGLPIRDMLHKAHKRLYQRQKGSVRTP